MSSQSKLRSKTSSSEASPKEVIVRMEQDPNAKPYSFIRTYRVEKKFEYDLEMYEGLNLDSLQQWIDEVRAAAGPEWSVDISVDKRNYSYDGAVDVYLEASVTRPATDNEARAYERWLVQQEKNKAKKEADRLRKRLAELEG